jgi:uncharacterized protein YkwD
MRCEGEADQEGHVPFHRLLLCASLLLIGTAAIWPGAARAEALPDVQLLRQSGCGGIEPAVGPLRHVGRLDRAAARWAAGSSVGEAAQRAGYVADKLAGLRITGGEAAILQTLRRTSCTTLMRRDLSDIGLYRRGLDAWLVLASPGMESLPRTSAAFAERVLELVNEARARGASCGARSFRPAGPVRASDALDQVAYGHAIDMAQHDYFAHEDRAGRTPADRVRASGYRERLVGENIAYGPPSPEDVVRGWLDSTGHCENIMDPRFAEMGIAYALGRAPQQKSGRGLYWVQVLADPAPAT